MLPTDVLSRTMLVIDELRKGSTLAKACRTVGIGRETVLRYVGSEPELRQMWDEAIEAGDDTLAELLVDIDEVHSDPKMAAVISKNIQWLLSRKRPAKYGDRITVTNVGTADQTIVDALRMALERIPLPNEKGAPPMLDVTPLPEPSLAELFGD